MFADKLRIIQDYVTPEHHDKLNFLFVIWLTMCLWIISPLTCSHCCVASSQEEAPGERNLRKGEVRKWLQKPGTSRWSVIRWSTESWIEEPEASLRVGVHPARGAGGGAEAGGGQGEEEQDQLHVWCLNLELPLILLYSQILNCRSPDLTIPNSPTKIWRGTIIASKI